MGAYGRLHTYTLPICQGFKGTAESALCELLCKENPRMRHSPRIVRPLEGRTGRDGSMHVSRPQHAACVPRFSQEPPTRHRISRKNYWAAKVYGPLTELPTWLNLQPGFVMGCRRAHAHRSGNRLVTSGRDLSVEARHASLNFWNSPMSVSNFGSHIMTLTSAYLYAVLLGTSPDTTTP